MASKTTTKKKAGTKAKGAKKERHAAPRKLATAKKKAAPVKRSRGDGLYSQVKTHVALLARGKEFGSADAMAAVEGLSLPNACTYLSLLARHGFAKRVRRGVYVRAGRG